MFKNQPIYGTLQEMIMQYFAMGSLSVVFLLSHIFISIRITAAQLYCNNTANFTTNGTYAENRNLILSSLASNLTADGGFYINGTIGQDPNKVFAHALCRGDYSPTACSSCVNSTIQDLISNCSLQYEAFSWGECLVRYAHRSFFGVTEVNPVYSYYNTGDISWDTGDFYDIWSSLMDRVLTKASNGSSRLKYATGEANLTKFQNIYALMQCTPDLSQSDCGNCLRQNVAQYESCCRGKQGGAVVRPSCWFRWDLYPFYTPMPDAPSPSPLVPTSSPPPIKDNGGIASQTVVIIVVPTIISMALVALSFILYRRRKTKQQSKSEAEDETTGSESLQVNFDVIRVATDNFSNDKKLGQGGFGAVYKGTLPNGQEIAVKRLSKNSEQGELEFKNEVMIVAKLQHRNLVRLIGFSLEGKERLLIYEFLPNSSLDYFIFDPSKRLLLDWARRYKIIGGIARGLLYLHEDSQVRIIHRDLKASNILIDAEMNPKISDFGMAKLFAMDQSQENTRTIVGTYGYMAPEYVMNGQFSAKSDVFSFGVLVLEIISGQKNTHFQYGEDSENLLTYAWRNWNERTPLNLIDPVLRVGSRSEMLRCIQIGLLCVQENVTNRPSMASVVLMLTSQSLSVSVPSRPAFFMHSTIGPEMSSSLNYSRNSTVSDQSKSKSVQISVNEASISELDPR